MNVYLAPRAGLSRAMTRVSNALRILAPPHVKVVKKIEEADLVVLHVIGYPDTLAAVGRCVERGQRFAMIQYCLRTTQRPSVMSWAPLWLEADVVWSYYNLPQMWQDENFIRFGDEPNWYCSPLGVDADVFTYSPSTSRLYTILTSGYVGDTECIYEAADAVRLTDGCMYHLGPDDLHLNSGVKVEYHLGINDDELALAYQQSRFVAGLRRIEGFELPAAEGLLCGARPIMFDAPHYRQWFGSFAEYIPEGPYDSVVSSLQQLFEEGPRPVTEEERREAVELFDWRTIISGFWEKVGDA